MRCLHQLGQIRLTRSIRSRWPIWRSPWPHGRTDRDPYGTIQLTLQQIFKQQGTTRLVKKRMVTLIFRCPCNTYYKVRVHFSWLLAIMQMCVITIVSTCVTCEKDNKCLFGEQYKNQDCGWLLLAVSIHLFNVHFEIL